MVHDDKIPAAKPFAYGDRLRTFIKTTYKTARKLSKRTGIDATALSLYCAGQRSPGFRHMKALFDAGLSLDWLLADESELHLFSMHHAGSTAPPLPQQADQLTDGELMAQLLKRMTAQEKRSGESGEPSK